MCARATKPGGGARRGWDRLLLVASLLACTAAAAQTPASGTRLDWRRIGNSAIEISLASPASGPVERVWFSADGARLYVRTRTGRVFETPDYERWQPSAATPPGPAEAAPGGSLPGASHGVRAAPLDPARLYAFGRQVFRSDDGGGSWTNLTAFRQQSIIGGGMSDLALSPLDSEELVVANAFGIWRSADGGLSWTGLNESLPNLPVRRLAALPAGARGVRLIKDDLSVIEWAPGEKQAWRAVPEPVFEQEATARRALSAALGTEVTALAMAGEFVYLGSADGGLLVSVDRGQSWTPSPSGERGAVRGFFVDAGDPRLALAALAGDPDNGRGPRVLRTINGGQFWDDLSSDLPEGAAHGIVADRPSGTVYVGTDSGVFMARADLFAAGPAAGWTRLGGLPEARALDVKLDDDGNQLYAALEGYGVYAAMAPHRLRELRLANAADFSSRAASPGSLLSVLGARIQTARAGNLVFPVLATSEFESQIQVPFEVRGSVALALDTGSGSVSLAVPVESVSPAVFVDRDGTPLVLNADSGVLLDVMNPARSNARLQILATGLGRVRPDWPTGMPGPEENPPQVAAQVRAYLDREPVEVTRAVLAPGYIGIYLVEVQLPAIVNSGPAELYVEAEGVSSNRVRIWIEP